MVELMLSVAVSSFFVDPTSEFNHRIDAPIETTPIQVKPIDQDSIPVAFDATRSQEVLDKV